MSGPARRIGNSDQEVGVSPEQPPVSSPDNASHDRQRAGRDPYEAGRDSYEAASAGQSTAAPRQTEPTDYLAWPTVDDGPVAYGIGLDEDAIAPAAESGPDNGLDNDLLTETSGRARRSHRRRPVRLLVTVCAGVIGLVVGDLLAATMSVPLLGGPGFTSPSTDTQWVVVAFALPYAAILPIAGRYADVIGARRMLAIGLFVFALAAAVAMEAPTWTALLAARGAQGLGAALMVPASLSMLLTNVSAARQTASVGIWSAATGLAGIVAYAAGGYAGETLRAGWRVLFVPSAVAGAFLLCLAVTLPKPKPRTGPLPDVIGCLLLSAGLGLITWTVVQNPDRGWDGVTIATAAGGALLLIAAAVKSHRHAEPAIDYAVWRIGRYSVGTVVSALFGLFSYPLLVIAPVYLAGVWEGPRELLGAALAPIPVGIVIASVIGAKIAKRRGPRPVFYIGSLAVAGACLALLRLVFKGSGFTGIAGIGLFEVWLAIGVVLGLGFGFLQTGTAAAATLTVDARRYGTGLGASLAAWQIGGIVGLTATVVLLDQEPGTMPFPGYVVAVAGCLVVAVLAGWVGLFFRPGGARPAASASVGASSTASSSTSPSASPGTSPGASPSARPASTRRATARPAMAAPVMPLSAPVPADMLDNWDPSTTLDDPAVGTRPVTLEGQIVPSIPAQAPPPPPSYTPPPGPAYAPSYAPPSAPSYGPPSEPSYAQPSAPSSAPSTAPSTGPLAAPVPLAFTAFATPPPAPMAPVFQPMAMPEEDPAAHPQEATEAMLEQMKATTRRIHTLAEALHTYLDTPRERSS
ncbi:MFS transporter [Streptosporangiaceae bacterium NEAU-GS5]|nr:MFS transporter [Streptosporangiaceae bacterium NEAU-GS5]